MKICRRTGGGAPVKKVLETLNTKHYYLLLNYELFSHLSHLSLVCVAFCVSSIGVNKHRRL